MEEKKILRAPFTTEMITPLRAGDMCYISGTTYTARGAAYLCLVEMLERGEEVPFDFEGQAVYYTGPCPAKPEQPIGSVGPTTRGRMDTYSPTLVAHGLRMMIGKGLCNPEAVNTVKQYKGVYFAAVNGATALIGECVGKAKVIALDNLGPGAIHKLRVEELPVIIVVDSLGRDVCSLGRSQYVRHWHLSYDIRLVITYRMNGVSVPHSTSFSCLGAEIRTS